MPRITLRRTSFIISSADKQEFISWDKIKTADYAKGFIILKFKSGRKLKLSNDTYLNFTFLFKALPEFVKATNRFVQEHKNYFSGLEKCEICNYVAVKKGICFVCGNETYEKLLSENEQNLPKKEKYLQLSKKYWQKDNKSFLEEQQIIPFSL